MNPGTVRRQFWLLLILGGLGLLWLKSSVSDRYGDLSGYDGASALLPIPPGLGKPELLSELARPDTWYYAGRHESTAIAVNWRGGRDTFSVEVITIDSGRVTRRVEAELTDGYHPRTIRVHDAAGRVQYGLAVRGDSMYVSPRDGRRSSRIYPYPRNAIFEDLVLVQAMAWKELEDSVTTRMIAFGDLGVPVRVFNVSLHKPDALTLLITASPAQTAKIRFADDSRHVASYCTTVGDCLIGRRDSTLVRALFEGAANSASAEDAP